MSLREIDAWVTKQWEIRTGQRGTDEEELAKLREREQRAKSRNLFFGPPLPPPPIDPEIGF